MRLRSVLELPQELKVERVVELRNAEQGCIDQSKPFVSVPRRDTCTSAWLKQSIAHTVPTSKGLKEATVSTGNGRTSEHLETIFQGLGKSSCYLVVLFRTMVVFHLVL